MSNVLITGASGFIGNALARSMSANHKIICLSRRDPEIAGTIWIRGSFGSFEDLRQLNAWKIDVVVHLGAVTGGCTEGDAVLVNCEGTRCLMRYLIDRGCTKYVFASSIALVGFQSPQFRPIQIPIPDDHPCLDRDGYGLSKHLMEQIAHYYSRQNELIDVINLRLSSVVNDDATPQGLSDLGEWSLGSITVTVLSDVVRLFSLAAEADPVTGVRTMNATCSRAWSTIPTAEVLRHWWGNEVDLSHYEQKGHKHDSAYDVARIAKELGFVASKTLAIL